MFSFEEIAARAMCFSAGDAVVAGAGIDIDDLMLQESKRLMNALHACVKAGALVASDYNRADHRSSLLRRNML